MRRGFAIAELFLGFFILALTTVVMLTVFSSSGRQALQTRNRTAAIMLANSLMDEIEAHPYGAPEPLAWATGTVRPVRVIVQGRAQQMDFNQTLSFENGSFLGKTAGTRDLVTITLTWKEGEGNDNGNKSMAVQVPVWR